MKIFVITADIELTQKPDWLEDFRRRYDDDYPYHVTLKLPCYIEDHQVADIKNKLDGLFSTLGIVDHLITLEFNKLHMGMDAPGGGCIMIDATKGGEIDKLQSKIVSALPEYKNYYEPEYKKYEKDFQPHITIARNLDEPTYTKAVAEIKDNYACTGKVSKIIFTVVNNFGPEEAKDSRNQIVYRL
jgi:2'-5' RNA ligase